MALLHSLTNSAWPILHEGQNGDRSEGRAGGEGRPGVQMQNDEEAAGSASGWGDCRAPRPQGRTCYEAGRGRHRLGSCSVQLPLTRTQAQCTGWGESTPGWLGGKAKDADTRFPASEEPVPSPSSLSLALTFLNSALVVG